MWKRRNAAWVSGPRLSAISTVPTPI
jgi:hypothetical protein